MHSSLPDALSPASFSGNVASELPDLPSNEKKAAMVFCIHVGMTIEEVEKLLIQQTLTRLTSNRQAAATALGISRRALQYKLRRYNLSNL